MILQTKKRTKKISFTEDEIEGVKIAFRKLDGIPLFYFPQIVIEKMEKLKDKKSKLHKFGN